MSTRIQTFKSFLRCELTCYRSERNLGSGHRNIEMWRCGWWSCSWSCCPAGTGCLSSHSGGHRGVGGLAGIGRCTWKLLFLISLRKIYKNNCILIALHTICHTHIKWQANNETIIPCISRLAHRSFTYTLPLERPNSQFAGLKVRNGFKEKL